MTAKRVMAAAVKVVSTRSYFVSENRDNRYLPSFNLREIVEAQTVSFEWETVTSLTKPTTDPSNQYVTRNEIPNSEEWRVYELVVRHFLASVSRDAKVEVGGEFFRATGLIVEDLGYLNVWTYDKWRTSGQTEPPLLLTEADLIGLMDKHGIGTDATHAEHIEKIKERQAQTCECIECVPPVALAAPPPPSSPASLIMTHNWADFRTCDPFPPAKAIHAFGRSLTTFLVRIWISTLLCGTSLVSGGWSNLE
uniref:DNA topoisomerase n=1 Tax=Ditylenchus dipsaci TaxID=166011 RepID=A0A915EV05_9BILA